ncbi:MAG TPA: family 16 glycoside hydrolase [Bryobacteraceae bacterium]|nr:family 16 glycoside hydrolase [Bryobacteraceae bacterium]
MNARSCRALIPAAATLLITLLQAAEIKVDLAKEKTGEEPKTFQPIVGTWLVTEDGKDRVIMVDGRPWMAAQNKPTTLLAEKARAFYGASHEDFLDTVKQFAYYPIAVLNGLDNFSDGSISVKFKTVNGQLDRCSGILFNVKPSGDWLSIRYNDTENNIVLWRFHDGIRRSVKRGPEGKYMLDRAAWHDLKMTVRGTDFKAWIDGQLALEYTLTEAVSGKVGLWSKTDSTSYFKDYVVSPE